MDNKQKIILRFSVIYFALLGGFVAVLWQIIVIQTKERDKWLEAGKSHVAVETTIDPMRGNIYDCEGRLLVGSLPRYTLLMDTRVEALRQGGDTLFYQNVDAVAQGLAGIFHDKSAGEYRRILVDAFKRKDGRLKLQPRPVSYIEMQAVKELPLFCLGRNKSGLMMEMSHKRVHPFGSLAKRTLGGVFGETGDGISGLEKQFNEQLKGTPGLRRRKIVIEKPQNGYDLLTTIDADMQDVVESELRQQMEKTAGEWGCCILMDVKTGEIKAISNLDRLEDGGYAELVNHAVIRVEPGSTFKTVSLMAALDDGKIDYEDDSIEVYKAGWKYSDARIYDAHPRDTVYSIRDAMAVSSNIALAKIVTQSYEKKAGKFVSRLEKLGIADSVPCEIPGANTPKILTPNDATTLAKMSYGYSVEFSPLQMLTFYNGIANNGKMVSPLLVKEIQQNGSTVKRYKSQVLKSSLCSASTLRAIQECLHAVVWDNHLGTAAVNPWGGKKAQSDKVHIAGKTGTAQIFANGRYSNQRHRIAFVGYFPEEAPKYSCICVIHHPHNGGYDAGGNCGMAVRQIAERVMAYTGTTDSETMEMPYDSISKPRIKGGQQERIRKAAKGTKVHVSKVDSDWAKVGSDMQTMAVKMTSNEVPNVVGMGARDAVYAIEQTGMKAQLHGKGKVVKQSLAAGQKAVKGGMVYLELK